MPVERNFIVLIKQINDIMEKFANDRLRGNDLTFSQLRILDYINECKDRVAFKDIEKYFRIAQPTVVGIVKRLEVKGFVTICTDDIDRRVKKAFISEKGAELCREVCRHQEEMVQELTHNLSEKETAELYRMLMEIYKNLTD